MRKLALVLTIALFVPGAMAHGDFPPKRGGIAVWAGETLLEFVIAKERVVVYIDDHGEPVPVKGAAGTLVVPTEGGEGRAVTMRISDENAFEATRVSLKSGDKLLFFAKMPDGQVHVGEVLAP